MIFDKSQAILKLRPGSEFNIRDGKIEWLSKDVLCPSDDEIKKCEAEHVPDPTLEERLAKIEKLVGKGN